jgi:hypothetical protein
MPGSTAEQLLAELQAEMARLRAMEDQQRNAGQNREAREREAAAQEAGRELSALVADYNRVECEQHERRRRLFAALSSRPGLFVRFVGAGGPGTGEMLWTNIPADPRGRELWAESQVAPMAHVVTECRAAGILVDVAEAARP